MNLNIGGFRIGGKTITCAVLAFIAFVLFLMTCYTVGPGERGVLMTFNKVEPGPLQPGLHVKWPIIQKTEMLNVRVFEYKSVETAASKDLQDATTGVSINLNLLPNMVDKFFLVTGTVETFETNILNPSVANAVKVVTARYAAEDLVTNRDAVRNGIETEIRKAMEPYSVRIAAVNITNFRFGKKFADAIEDKQVAYQDSLKAAYVLDKVETDAKQQFAKAEQEARAIRELADANAYALKVKAQYVSPELVALTYANRWNGILPTTFSEGTGGPVPFFDIKAK